MVVYFSRSAFRRGFYVQFTDPVKANRMIEKWKKFGKWHRVRIISK